MFLQTFYLVIMFVRFSSCSIREATFNSTLYFENDVPRVTGIASINNYLYTIHAGSRDIQVIDKETMILIHVITDVENLVNLSDIVGDEVNSYLYVAGRLPSAASFGIRKLEVGGYRVLNQTAFRMMKRPPRLSVTSSGNVIVCSGEGVPVFREYTPDGELAQEVDLGEIDRLIVPDRAFKVTNQEYIVAFKMLIIDDFQGNPVEMQVVRIRIEIQENKTKATLIAHYPGSLWGWSEVRPYKDGSIIATNVENILLDRRPTKVLLISPSLAESRVLVGGVASRLCLDDDHLYLAAFEERTITMNYVMKYKLEFARSHRKYRLG